MKRVICLFLVLMLALSLSASCIAEKNYEISNIKLIFNGTRLVLLDENDNIIPLLSVDGKLYVPIQYFVESIGGTFAYDAASNTISVSLFSGNALSENSAIPSVEPFSTLGLFLTYSKATINKKGLISELTSHGITYRETTDSSGLLPLLVIKGDDSTEVRFSYTGYGAEQDFVQYVTSEYELSVGRISSDPYFQYKSKKSKAIEKFSSLDDLLNKAGIAH